MITLSIVCAESVPRFTASGTVSAASRQLYLLPVRTDHVCDFANSALITV